MSTVSTGSHRMKVRVGQSEFEAEGDESTVSEQYRMFLEAISGLNAGKPRSAGGNGDTVNSLAEDEDEDDEALTKETWGRFYSMEREKDVSLKVLPSTSQRTADALVLLLYGYLQIRQVDTVSGISLLAMARKSGLPLDRIDRNIPVSHNRYINRGGNRRGSRYSLNNQGMAYAQQLLEREAER